MAKKRKLSKTQATTTSKPEPEPEPSSQPEPEPEPSSQPEAEATPMEEVPVVKTEEEETPVPEPVKEEAIEEEVAEEEAAVEEEKPQSLAITDPTPDAEEDEDEKDPSSLQKLLEQFTKDQLVDLLRSAAGDHPDVLSSILRTADVDPAQRKIFVHGLGWDTSSETLTAFFGQYGEIEDCKAVVDKVTGKSKGYAFILFKHRRGARNALKEPQKKIGGRMTACQLASAGPPGPATPVVSVAPATPASEYTLRKIYVSNVGAELDPQKLLAFFSKFGEIEEGPMGLDKTTGKPRGFCLFVYKSPESAKKALEEPHKNFDGHVLHCQKAVDGPKGNKQVSRGSGSVPSSNTGYVGAAAGPSGHLMAPSVGGYGFNQPAPAAAGLNPALNQALTSLLVNQGAPGLGLTNMMGGLGSGGAPMGSAGMQGGYGNQGFGGYGYAQPGPGRFGNTQVGQGRGRPPYMGRK